MIEVDENERTVDIMEELDDIDKKFVETKGAKLKYKQKQTERLTTDDIQDECDTIKDFMEVETEAKVNEPIEEYAKQVEVKPIDDVSAKVKKEMNDDVIGYQLFK